MTTPIYDEDKIVGYRTIENDTLDIDDINNIFRLQKQLFLKTNIIFEVQECVNIWQWYSSDLCASWLFFPDNDEDILKHIESSHNFVDYISIK